MHDVPNSLDLATFRTRFLMCVIFLGMSWLSMPFLRVSFCRFGLFLLTLFSRLPGTVGFDSGSMGISDSVEMRTSHTNYLIVIFCRIKQII